MLAKSLELGGCGVQWNTPPEGAIAEHTDTQLVVREDTGLTWRTQLLPTEFALGGGEEAALAEDIELSSRAVFEVRWGAKKRPSDARPRTADPSWTPVIEAKLGMIGETRIARVVHWLASEPGEEVAVGHLFVPVEKGTIEVRISARTADPVTQVRAALDRTIEQIDVVAPPKPRLAEIEMPEPGAAVTAPVRFTPAPTVAKSERGEIVRLGVDGWRRTMHVWRVGRHKLKKQSHAGLVEHADKEAAAAGMASRSAPIDDYGVCLQVQQYVKFELDGFMRHAIRRWWVAGDGLLWQIGTDAPANVDRNAMLEELAAFQDSFRRI